MSFRQSLKTRFVTWVWKHTPDCATMSRLASRELETPLTLKVRLQMRLHFLICAWCERYYRQLKFLHRAGPHSAGHTGSLPEKSLSPEAKQRLLKRLREDSAP